MDNKKIPTGVGIAVIVIIAITVSVLVWKYEKSNEQIVSQTPDIIPQQNQETQESENNEESEMNMVEPKENKSLSVSKSAQNWRKICKNSKGGYNVKYPDEWTVKIAGFNGARIDLSDCNFSGELKGNPLLLYFAPPEKFSEASGISVFVEEKEPRTFNKIFKETKVAGEKATWVNEKYLEVYYNGKLYQISAEEDVTQSVLNDFLSTFEFLD